jgi:hypothetical protein
MRLIFAGLALALATLAAAAPAAAQSDDLTLLCTQTGGSQDFAGAKTVHVDISFATQLVALTFEGGLMKRYQNGLAQDNHVGFANTAQTQISFGLDDSDTYVIDRKTGEMTRRYQSQIWTTSSCVRETVATKF